MLENDTCLILIALGKKNKYIAFYAIDACWEAV
jgi:hypothetical protein